RNVCADHAVTLSRGAARYGYHSAAATAEVVSVPVAAATTRTRWPASARRTALVSPTMPAPSTVTSMPGHPAAGAPGRQPIDRGPAGTSGGPGTPGGIAARAPYRDNGYLLIDSLDCLRARSLNFLNRFAARPPGDPMYSVRRLVVALAALLLSIGGLVVAALPPSAATGLTPPFSSENR